MSTPEVDPLAYPSVRPRVSVEELLAAKNTQPIRSLDDLAAETFSSDEEVAEFVAFTYTDSFANSRRGVVALTAGAGSGPEDGGGIAARVCALDDVTG